MKIIYWSDFACPWCYIGEANLKQAIAELHKEDQIQLDMHSYELHPGAPKKAAGTLQEVLLADGYSAEEIRARCQTVNEAAARAGLNFLLENTRSTSTRDAHRLFQLARSRRDRDLTDRLAEHLFRAYFQEGQELADPAVLERIALAEGMDRTEVEALLQSDQRDDEVENDETQAGYFGVRGVPYFLIGPYTVPGALEKEQMKELLQNALKEDQNRFSGMSCGPDGCDIRK